MIREMVADAIEADVAGEMVENERFLTHVQSDILNEDGNYAELEGIDDVRILRTRIARKVRSETMWGDNLTLQYAAALLNLCIVQIRGVGSGACTFAKVTACDPDTTEKTICLFYDLDVHWELASFDFPGERHVTSLFPHDSPAHREVLGSFIAHSRGR